MITLVKRLWRCGRVMRAATRTSIATLAIAAPFLWVSSALLAPAQAAADISAYPDVARAASDVAAAIDLAARQKRRVLIDFGANWCPDCKILEENFQRAENVELLHKNFILVHVNVGAHGMKENADLAARYGIPLSKGIPALAVLDGKGRTLFSHKNGEYESMRSVDAKAVHEFLLRWGK